MNFARPPVNEVGLSVSLAEPFAFDPYDVRATHDLFRSEYPLAQRVEPTSGNEFEATMGLPPLNMQPVSRWWFISADSADVLQLQENYVARNWRRTVGIADEPAYPGFQKLLADFENALALLRHRNGGETGTLPAMRSCELMYDDIVPGVQRDGKFMLSEMLTDVSPQPGRMMANWQCAWLEAIPVPDSELVGTLQVQIAAAGLTEPDGAQHPIIRLVWKAGAPAMPWTLMRGFFEAAHAHISSRFGEVIERKVQESWGIQ